MKIKVVVNCRASSTEGQNGEYVEIVSTTFKVSLDWASGGGQLVSCKQQRFCGDKWVRRRTSGCGKLVSAGTAMATVVRRLLWCGGFRHSSRLTDPPSCLPPHKYSVSCSFFLSYFFLLTFTSWLAVVK